MRLDSRGAGLHDARVQACKRSLDRGLIEQSDLSEGSRGNLTTTFLCGDFVCVMSYCPSRMDEGKIEGWVADSRLHGRHFPRFTIH